MMLKENLELKEELAVARGVGKTAEDTLTALKLSSAKDREEMISLKMQLNELTKEGEALRKKSSRVEELEGKIPLTVWPYPQYIPTPHPITAPCLTRLFNVPRCACAAHRKRDEVELASFHRRLHDEKAAGQKRYDDLMLEKTRSDERVVELEVG